MTKNSDILDFEKENFEELYSQKKCPDFETKTNIFLDGLTIPTLSDETKDACERVFNGDEFLETLNSMDNGKSPGTDGLTTEFYRFFWSHIKQPLIEYFY